MVNSVEARDPFPHHSLDRIRELAIKQSVAYVGTRVSLDIANLGLNLESVCDCIAQLDAAVHFRHSERYSTAGPWHDVYGCTWSASGGPPDDLYLKLRLGRSCLIVDLCSFHLDR
jgi:hypothetical protein